MACAFPHNSSQRTCSSVDKGTKLLQVLYYGCGRGDCSWLEKVTDRDGFVVMCVPRVHDPLRINIFTLERGHKSQKWFGT